MIDDNNNSNSSNSADDWEKDDIVEIKLKLDNIKLNVVDSNSSIPSSSSPSSSSSAANILKPAVIMPSYLDSTEEGDFNFNRHDDDRIVDEPLPVIDEPIHTALLTAAANPKERMFVLHLEDSFLKFVKSDETQMEYPGAMNSFRRLLVYQSAYRFHVSHTIVNNNNYYDNSDPGIILIYKTPETRGCIPKQLLIDLENPSTDADSGSAQISNENESIAPKKVLMMKRNPSNEIKKENTKTRQDNSSADKERAYAEARARIFGNLGVENNAEGSVSSNSNTTELNNSKGNNSVNRSTSASPALSNAKGSTDSLKSHEEVGFDRTSSLGSMEESDQTKMKVAPKIKKATDVNSWKGNKAIEKNQYAELTDPDFMRMRDTNTLGNGQDYYEMPSEMYQEQYYYQNGGGVYNNVYPLPPAPMYPQQYPQQYYPQQYPPQHYQQQYPPAKTQQYATRQQYGENYRNNNPS